MNQANGSAARGCHWVVDWFDLPKKETPLEVVEHDGSFYLAFPSWAPAALDDSGQPVDSPSYAVVAPNGSGEGTVWTIIVAPDQDADVEAISLGSFSTVPDLLRTVVERLRDAAKSSSRVWWGDSHFYFMRHQAELIVAAANQKINRENSKVLIAPLPDERLAHADFFDDGSFGEFTDEEIAIRKKLSKRIKRFSSRWLESAFESWTADHEFDRLIEKWVKRTDESPVDLDADSLLEKILRAHVEGGESRANYKR
jgi:hypothetical protein